MKVVGEGTLTSPVRSFAWSPTVDLCVFVMAKEVSAHRLSGQKVWSVSGLHMYDLEFTHVTWRDDGAIPLRTCLWIGKVIATGLDDGSVFVLDVQDGRKIHEVMLNSLPQGPISCLNWIGEDVNATASDVSTVNGIGCSCWYLGIGRRFWCGEVSSSRQSYRQKVSGRGG